MACIAPFVADTLMLLKGYEPAADPLAAYMFEIVGGSRDRLSEAPD